MKQLLKKFLPASFKKRLRMHFKTVLKKEHHANLDRFERKAVAFELEEKHLANLKGLPTRAHLLALLPKEGVVAELGVDEGNFSEEILKINNPKKLHLVDVWQGERYNQDKRKGVETKLAREIGAGRVSVDIGYSTEIVNTYPDAYFDWVYIDTAHSYHVTIDELTLYSNKVKPGGYMAGHDYVVGNWRGIIKYGVIEAVHEFCVKENWELVFMTMETRAHRSFAIRRIR
tara:strand:+ start:21056 stop:21745 length:690 start_codon:yes stop_codon:yes gene_type:complete